MGGPAFILTDLWVVDSTDESKVIARFRGMAVISEWARRIQQAYVNPATLLGLYFRIKLLRQLFQYLHHNIFVEHFAVRVVALKRKCAAGNPAAVA